eukprot:TRINITY_DN2430_c0_g1_i1.p1 TRINITY_DN2430_c0_g1~~TRINITY_DN2430_c0_g1_i1.p1  ORF type:complete len:213 (+),score=45.57 TRINITY_DN2430_c0_g1_i1:66-704(+)
MSSGGVESGGGAKISFLGCGPEDFSRSGKRCEPQVFTEAPQYRGRRTKFDQWEAPPLPEPKKKTSIRIKRTEVESPPKDVEHRRSSRQVVREKPTSLFGSDDSMPETRSPGKRIVEERSRSQVFLAETKEVSPPRPHSARRVVRPIGEETEPMEMKKGIKLSDRPKTTIDKDPGMFVDRFGRRLSNAPEKGQRFVHKGPAESAKGLIYFQTD